MVKLDLITGFLGSGKTTFIKEYAQYLVDRGEKVAIIVNDYGAINVDRLLLGEALGDSCHLEMVIGGDADCTRRRLKTKLIAMAMERYTYVIVEPSGIFDVDDFFDMLFEEPLERWYEIGNVITIVEDGIENNLSEEARYLFLAEAAKAGTVVISKLGYDITEGEKKESEDRKQTKGENQVKIEGIHQEQVEAENQVKQVKIEGIHQEQVEASIYEERLKKLVNYINEGLEFYKCTRRFDAEKKKDIYIWKRGEISEDDFKRLSCSGYRSGEMVGLPVLKENGFDTCFFFHVETDLGNLEDTIKGLFADEKTGNIIRLKGFIKNSDEEWLEVNATRDSVTICPISTGQELFIVIGEGLDEAAIGAHWISYCNKP